MIYGFKSFKEEFKDKEEQPWAWALVSNAIDDHEFGEEHEIRRGTKHFFPGAKIYVAPIQWGDGFESIPVIGRYRYNHKFKQVVMKSKQLTNFRLQKVYNPTVLETMESSKYYWWSNSTDDRNTIIKMLKWANPAAYQEAIDKYLDGDVSKLDESILEKDQKQAKEEIVAKIKRIISDYETEKRITGIVEIFEMKNSENCSDELWIPLLSSQSSNKIEIIIEKHNWLGSKEYEYIGNKYSG